MWGQISEKDSFKTNEYLLISSYLDSSIISIPTDIFENLNKGRKKIKVRKSSQDNNSNHSRSENTTFPLSNKRKQITCQKYARH